MESEKNSLSLGRTLLYCALPVIAVVILFQCLIPSVPLYTPSKRTMIHNQLRQIMVAMHSHQDVHKHLPPSAIRDKEGRPLLSWRVAILPYIEEEALYRRFKLDEPWDSPHNKELLRETPALYLLPDQMETTSTFFQVFIGPGTAFERAEKPLTMKVDFPDGVENTILIVVGDKEVPWTKPEDVPFHSEAYIAVTGQGLKAVGMDPMVYVGMGDASVRTLPKDFDEQAFRHAIIRNDGKGPGKLFD